MEFRKSHGENFFWKFPNNAMGNRAISSFVIYFIVNNLFYFSPQNFIVGFFPLAMFYLCLINVHNDKEVICDLYFSNFVTKFLKFCAFLA